MTTTRGGQSWTRPLSRRAFLQTLAVAASGAWVAACGPARGEERALARRLAFGPAATPQTVLPIPMPDAPPTAMAASALTVAEFLALSTLLTGVANLDPELGQIYLQSLGATAGDALAAFYTATGLRSAAPPTTADELTATGVLANEAQRALGTTITKLWYSGIYSNAAGEETVATFVDALAWKSLLFTKPLTICREPGFWSEAWEPVLD